MGLLIVCEADSYLGYMIALNSYLALPDQSGGKLKLSLH